MCPQIADTATPRGFRRSIQASGKLRGLHFLTSHYPLQRPKRNVVQSSLNFGRGCGVEVLDIHIRSDASAERLCVEIIDSQPSARQLICALEFAQFNATS